MSQIISEEGRRGTTRFPTELLHDLIRTGNQAITSTVGKVQDSVGKLVESSMDRLGPVRRMREETDVLRQRLEELEEALGKMEASNGSPDEEKSNGEPETLDMNASTRSSEATGPSPSPRRRAKASTRNPNCPSRLRSLRCEKGLR